MPKSCNLLLACCTLLLLAPVAAQAFTFLSAGPFDKPDDPSVVYNRTVFGCEPPDSLTVTVDLVRTLADSTIGRPSAVDAYACRLWPETGPELVYKLDVAAPLELHAVLTSLDETVDLDLFLLSDCDSDSCLVGANIEFIAELEPRIYYLVVDGVSGGAAAFELELTARRPGLPDTVCEPGGATAVACADTTVALVGETLFGQDDLLRAYDCGSFPKTSGENWYEVTLPATHEVTINVINVPTELDPCLWVFATCGTTAECLEFADANTGGEGESVTLVNDGAGDRIYYVGVDAVRPPTDPSLGSYDIQFQCQSNVPTAKTSFGGLKSLYR